jgi:predicted DNA-binding ribbon-helix-helix protein
MTISALVTEIYTTQKVGNLSSAIRVYILAFYQDQIARDHRR